MRGGLARGPLYVSNPARADQVRPGFTEEMHKCRDPRVRQNRNERAVVSTAVRGAARIARGQAGEEIDEH